MTLLLRLALPLFASLLLPAAALAQQAQAATPAAPAQASAPGKGESQALQLFKLLDANGDGRVSWAEAQVAIRLKPSLAELFRRTDTNGDGYLTQDEIRAEAARQRAERLARREREAQAGKGNVPAR
ncbi:EF-hand domain-containing protein [Ottowia sp.]|uniref:EF-hand domain-containing protein n=1 Tax=Ottowia sp. TaxID=1898956 RepID=UPI002BE3D36B|nr:EF-hand domain-containing protein [Ottowia sp.]